MLVYQRVTYDWKIHACWLHWLLIDPKPVLLWPPEGGWLVHRLAGLSQFSPRLATGGGSAGALWLSPDPWVEWPGWWGELSQNGQAWPGNSFPGWWIAAYPRYPVDLLNEVLIFLYSQSGIYIMWVKQLHKASPSHHHFFRRYVYHVQSWVVYGIVFPHYYG